MKKGIIFDMDGTLWDSSKGVADCWTEVVKKEYPSPDKDVRNGQRSIRLIR